MHRIIKGIPRLRNLSIRRKLILLYLIAIALPLLFLSIFLTESLHNTVLNDAYKHYSNTLDQLSSNLTNRLAGYADIVNSLCYNDSINTYLETEFQSDYDAYTQYNQTIQPLMKLSLYKEKDASIKFYTENDTIQFSSGFLHEVAQSGFVVDVSQLQQKNTLTWLGVTKGPSGNEICCCSAVKNYMLYPNKLNGILFLYFDEANLYSLISEASKTSSIIYITDGSGNVYSCSDKSQSNKKLSDIFGNQTEAVEQGRQTITLNDRDYIATQQRYDNQSLGIGGWKLIYLIPVTDLNRQLANIWITNLALAVLCILLCSIAVILFSRGMTGRFKTLMEKMDDVSTGNTMVSLTEDRSDEIGELYKRFNSMVNDLNRLVTEVYEANVKIKDSELKYSRMELEKREAEILALQNQINPHFLFNTLESIRMNALLHNDAETADVIKLFGLSFRTLIYDKDALIPVREEMNNIQNFISIQKYRHGDKLRFHIRVSNDAAEVRIPKLLIQPIVENAVFHGVEGKRGKGVIRISVKRENENLGIVVEDNGEGMDEESLSALMQSIRSDEKGPANYALRNIYSRLRVIYADRFSFAIASVKGKGTRVDVAVPVGIEAGVVVNVQGDDH